MVTCPFVVIFISFPPQVILQKVLPPKRTLSRIRGQAAIFGLSRFKIWPRRSQVLTGLKRAEQVTGIAAIAVFMQVESSSFNLHGDDWC
jgi:hypothetical protein